MSNKATKFHPILFSTPMIQAIDKNIKTKTRRTKGLEKFNENPDDWKFGGIAAAVHFPTEKNDLRISHYFIDKQTGVKEHVFCPYELGDVFWVRETHRPLIDCTTGKFARWDYKADMPDEFHKQYPHKWKPSIFMPKEACRTFLKVKSIRVERLQDISEEDAQAEGAHFLYHGLGTVIIDSHPDWEKLYKPRASYKDGFHYIWKYINGEVSWQFNPFVWVYEFEKIEKPLDFI